MSKHTKQRDGLNDVDMAALFASDNREPPNELDNLILANAHEAAPANTLADDDEPFLQRYAPLFGTAAVLMIAIALTPISQSPFDAKTSTDMTLASAPESVAAKKSTRELSAQPDSGISEQAALNDTNARKEVLSAVGTSSDRADNIASRDDTRLNTDAAVNAAADSDAEGAKISTTPSSFQSNAISATTGATREQAFKQELEKASPEIESLQVPNAPSSSAVSQLARSRVSESNATAETTADIAVRDVTEAKTQLAPSVLAQADPADTDNATSQRYRSSALLWVIEIKRLFKERKFEQAREELDGFREKFPDSTHERLLPQELQTQ